MEQFFSLDEVMDLVRRRFRVIAAVTAAGCVLSLFVALQQVHLYQSSEVIQVARPMIDDELAKPTADGSAARRLQLIEQRLMTRGTVLDIAAKYDLFADRPGLTVSEKVTMIRDAISIEGVAAAREGFSDDGAMSVLTITATFDTPQKARQVAHEFAQRTLALSARSRLETARETQRFFVEEEARLAAELIALEQELTAYRRDNDLTISGGLEFRRDRIASINEALLDIERDKIALRGELTELDQGQRPATLERQAREINAQLKSLAEQQALLEGRLESLTRTIETTPRIERDLGAFERRREKLRDELDVVSARLAEAEVGFKLEKRRQGERLTVIEPAALPDFPITPSRKKLALLGGVASLVLGMLAAVLLDLRHPVIRTPAHMQSRVGIVPVVTIPPLETRRRRSGRLGRRSRS